MPRLKRSTCKDSSFASKVEWLLATTVGGPWTAPSGSFGFNFPLVQWLSHTSEPEKKTWLASRVLFSLIFELLIGHLAEEVGGKDEEEKKAVWASRQVASEHLLKIQLKQNSSKSKYSVITFFMNSKKIFVKTSQELRMLSSVTLNWPHYLMILL